MGVGGCKTAQCSVGDDVCNHSYDGAVIVVSHYGDSYFARPSPGAPPFPPGLGPGSPGAPPSWWVGVACCGPVLPGRGRPGRLLPPALLPVGPCVGASSVGGLPSLLGRSLSGLPWVGGLPPLGVGLCAGPRPLGFGVRTSTRRRGRACCPWWLKLCLLCFS